MCLDDTNAWVWNEIRLTQVSQMRNELHFNVLALVDNKILSFLIDVCNLAFFFFRSFG